MTLFKITFSYMEILLYCSVCFGISWKHRLLIHRMQFVLALVALIRCWPKMYPKRSRNVQRRAPPQQAYNQQMYPQARPGVVVYEKEPFRHY